jgi:primosomal replication protein N
MATKKGNSDGAGGSKSKRNTMKSYHPSINSGQVSKNEVKAALKKQKKENAQDEISKSVFKAFEKRHQIKFNHLTRNIMSTLKNKVQLIGNVGQAPELTVLDSGKKVIRFSLATNEFYRNAAGEKVQQTQWHNLVAWGRTAEIIHKYVTKGKEIAIEGKLASRSYETKEGEKRFITEVIVNEVFMMGNKTQED